MSGRQPEGEIKDACRTLARRDRRFFWNIEGKGINGIPDTMCERYSGRGVVLCEFKTPDGVLSEQQKRRIAQLRDAGQPVAVCRSVEDWKQAVGYPGYGDDL